MKISRFQYISGLTESEVAEALKLSGESISSVQEETKPSENTIKQPISAVEVVKADVSKPSIWIRIVKWIRNLVLAGCLTYTTYKLFIRVFDFLSHLIKH